MKNIFENYKIFNIDPTKLRSKGFYKNFVINERESFWDKRSKLNKEDIENSCFLCDNKINNKEFLEYEGYKLYQCSKCNLVFANIYVDETYTDIVYDNQQYEDMIKIEVLDTYEYRKKTFGKERLEYIIDKCNFDKNKDYLLDLGCGPGYFLKYLSENNITAKGLELTDYLVDICTDKGLDVEQKELLLMDDKLFNIITMFDVLEHLSNPIDFLTTANSKLKKNGSILMYTPNIHSFAFYFQKGKQNLLLPYEHLCFYNEQSLKYLAKKTGFKITSIEYFGLDIVDYLSMKEYEDDISYNKNLKEIIPYLQAVLDKSQLSNHMRIVFTKEKDVV